jgi:pantoate--beta-alanine ligase
MKVIEHVDELTAELRTLRAQGKSIGWMGTSGAMHDGHLSLVRQAKADNDVALMSWTGNMSFPWAGSSNPSYGRDEKRDSEMAERAGTDLLYLPIGAEVFPEPPFTKVTTPGLHRKGLTDPAHLDTVALFMAKFLSVIGGCTCYMGEKDWEQLTMMRCVISDLSLPVDRFVVVPTARDVDGVPLSSRNAKLTAQQRADAVVVPQALQAAAQAVRDGERDPAGVRAVLVKTIESVAPVAYAHVVTETLQEQEVLSGPIRILAAARFGDVDILDNVGLLA